ncbi:MAG: hypothetical protein M3N16_03755, partial [Actinomycetota bacterium]|nr:hypothetical protein [Actinomycetota bacterium]
MSATGQATDDTRTYRGRSLEELIPRIKEELGPDAVITRRREGLAGGIGGFFQRSFVEVEARPGGAGAGEGHADGEASPGRRFPPAGPRLDVYDDGPATPPPYGA